MNKIVEKIVNRAIEEERRNVEIWQKRLDVNRGEAEALKQKIAQAENRIKELVDARDKQ